MPLRDHFRPPLDHRRHWEGMHGGWPMIIVAHLREKLPRGFFAEPKVHSGSTAEIDVASFEDEREFAAIAGGKPIAGGNHGGVATAVWAPRPSLSATIELPGPSTSAARERARAAAAYPARRCRTAMIAFQRLARCVTSPGAVQALALRTVDIQGAFSRGIAKALPRPPAKSKIQNLKS